MTIGFRILPLPVPPAATLVSALGAMATAHLSDSMNRMAGADAGLRPAHDGTRLIGIAVTVRTSPGDNLMVHKAIDLARPGDVVVVDAGGVLARAIVGDIMSTLAAKRGLAGLVIDGAIRDAAEIRAGSFPVYARGVTHRGPFKEGPGEINVPVSIGGMVVNPGDIVVGDADGIVAVPQAAAEAVLAAALALAEKERRILAEIEAGTIDRSWVDAALRARGCSLD